MFDKNRISLPPRLGVVTIDNLAHDLETSPRTIRRWIQRGILPAPQRLGRTAFWSQDCIRAALIPSRGITP